MIEKWTAARLLCLLAFALIPPAFGDEHEPKKEAEKIPEARTYVTEHSARIGGRTIDYTVTAGTMRLTNDDGEPVALMGFTAYVKKGARQSASLSTQA